ncbi:alpha-2,8-sialyltransferase 8E-like [Glandiceps talaboti]
MFRRFRRLWSIVTLIVVISACMVLIKFKNTAVTWRNGPEGNSKHQEDSSRWLNSRLIATRQHDLKTEPVINQSKHSDGEERPDTRNEQQIPIDDGTSLLQMKYYADNVSLPWKQNLSALNHMRTELDKNLTAVKHSVVTQENTPQDSSLHFYAYPGKAAITEKVHKLLPKRAPFPEERFKRCSVIGNSGILVDSGCGYEIDKADYVFRCNAAPIDRFSRDAGKKTNLTTVNKSTLHDKYMTLKSLDTQYQFQHDMSEYNGLLWIPVYANRPFLDDCYNAKRVFQSEKSDIVFGNPHHFIQISKYWAARGLRGIMTTGMYLLSTALNLCEETHVFGFWPFLQTPDGSSITFHYYDEIAFTNRTKRIHAIPFEFELIYKLHQDRIVKMHIGKCG